MPRAFLKVPIYLGWGPVRYKMKGHIISVAATCRVKAILGLEDCRRPKTQQFQKQQQ
jgi:hypothetical protein